MGQSDDTNTKQPPSGFVSLSASLKDPIHNFHRLLETTLHHCTSRRDLLRILGGASASIPLWGSLARAATSFTFDADDTNARFSLNGIPLCHLRTDCFDGKPKLLVRKEEGTFAIRLVQAVFPGTNLPADLILAGSRTAVGWESRLRIASLQFDATFPFEQWLIGQPVARSPVTFPFALATEQGTTVNTRNGTSTVLYPDWTIQLQGANSARVTSAVGEISGDEVQIELIPSETSPILLENLKRPRTRIWVKGKKLSPALVEIEPIQVSFSTDRLTTLVELQRTADGTVHSASSFEGTSVSVPVGQIALGSQDPLQAVPARQMCVTVTGRCDDQKVAVRADLVRNCAWVKKGEVYAELVLSKDGRPFQIEKDGDCECKTPNGVTVGRIIAPLAGVDEARFVRRHAKAKGDGTYDLSQVVHDDGLDGLDWLNGFHPFSREIPLDQFDLQLRRGQDGFVCTVRFHNINLKSSLWSGLTLVASSRSRPPESLIEFDFGPQHVQEEALYVTQLLKNGLKENDPDFEKEVARFPDELILRYHPGHLSCQELLNSRANGKFSRYRRDAFKQYLSLIGAGNAKDNKCGKAQSRVSQSSWLTFQLCTAPGCDSSLPFTLDALLSWLQPSTDRSKELLKLKPPTLAAPLNEKLIEQVTTLRNASTSPLRPKSLAEDHTQAATLIQAPYRLGLAPIGSPAWKASPAVTNAEQRPVELWNLKVEHLPMRVVWSPDFEGNNFWAQGYPHWPDPDPKHNHGGVNFRASLDSRDRHELVALSSGFGQLALRGSEQVIPIEDPDKVQDRDPRSIQDLRDLLRKIREFYPCFDLEREGLFIPKPINAALLMLTSLGATAKLLGTWSPPANAPGGALTIQRWDHKAQIGRDVKVVVEYKGFLFPIGHPAVLVKETERHLILDTDHAKDGMPCMVARLVQRFFIRVPAFTRSFPATGQPFESRAWPFSKLATETFITPDLDDPAGINSNIVLGLGQQAFWPKVNKTLVQFPFFDRSSKTHFSTPLVFVDNQVSHSPDMLKEIARAYRILVDKIQRPTEGNQASHLKRLESSECIATVTSGAISWAPAANPGDTEYSAIRFLLDVDVPSPTKGDDIISQETPHKKCGGVATPEPCLPPGQYSQPDGQEWEDVLRQGDTETYKRAFRVNPAMEAENQPPFYPHIRQALLEAEQLSKISGQSRETKLVEFDGGYLREGFSPTGNPGEIFLRFVDGGVTLSFSNNSSASGGFASPTTGIAAISRRRGPIGGDTSQCLPQSAFYRRIPESANALERESDEITKLRELRKLGFRDPVSKSRVGDFDPKEFFAQTMGDAKLLGVVRLVDILDVAMKASGTTMPEIVQQVTDLVSSEAAPRISAAVLRLTDDQQIGPAINNVPRLASAMAVLRTRAVALREASGDSAKAVAVGAQLVQAAREFRDAVRAVADDPRQLLPQDALQFFESLEQLRTGIEPLLSRKALDTYVERIRQGVLDTLEVELSVLIEEAKKQPFFAEAQRLAETVRLEIQDLRQKLISKVHHELLGMVETLPRILAPLEELVDRVQKDLDVACGSLESLIKPLDQIVERALDSIKNHSNEIYRTTNEVRVHCEQTKEKIKDTGKAGALKQLCDELSGLTTSITGMVESMDRLRLTKKVEFENPCAPGKKLVFRPELIHAYLASTRDILRKASRLAMFLPLPRVGKALPQDEGCALTKPLLEILQSEPTLDSGLEAIRGQVHQYIQDLISPLQEVLKNPKLPEQLTNLRDLLNKMQKEAATDVVGWICQHASFIQKYEQLYWMIVAVLRTPKEIEAIEETIKNGLQDKLANGPANVSLTTLCCEIDTACVNLQKVLGKQATKINQMPLKTWISDSLRARVQVLNDQIAALNESGKQLNCNDKDQKPLPSLKILSGYLKQLPTFSEAVRTFITDLDRTFRKGDIDEITNIREQIEKRLAEVLDIPTRATLSYKWKTPVQAYPGGSGSVFEPEGDRTLSISAVTTIDPLKSLEPEFKIVATLSAFKINLLGSTPFLSIKFEPLIFTAGSGQKADLTVKVKQVDFGGQLSFVQELQKYLKDKFGLDVTPWSDGPGVVVTYAFSESVVQMAAFTLQNVGFTVSSILPFDNTPARFRFGLASASKPFLVSAGIYGGGGYVAIQALADRIEFLEFSFEYGLVTAFKFGPATGTGRITAGIYIRLASGSAIVSGFFNASGNADVAGLITIDAMFRVQLWYYGDEGTVRGKATFRISFKIAIVNYGYDVTVDYAREGQKDNSANKRDASQLAEAAETPMPILLAASGQPDIGMAYGGSQTKAPHTRISKNVNRSSDSTVDQEVDLAQCLLRDSVWQEYWEAFEEEFHECR